MLIMMSFRSSHFTDRFDQVSDRSRMASADPTSLDTKLMGRPSLGNLRCRITLGAFADVMDERHAG